MPVDRGRPVPPDACRPDGPTPDQLGAKRSVLYSGPRALGALAERRGQLFVVDSADGLLRLPDGKTELERAVAGAVGEFLVADLNLYWLREGGLWRASISDTNATPDPVAMQLGHQASLLRFDADHLYFADTAARGAFRIAITGGMVETIASGLDVRDQVVQSGFVYLADASSKRVRRVMVDGSAPMVMSPAALSEIDALATDGVGLYWADDFELVATKLDDPTSRKSLATAGPRADGSPARLVRLEVADKRLYFSDDGGNFGWTALDGSKCGLIVKAAGTLNGSDVAADGKAAFLSLATASAHELWRLSLQ